MCRAMKQPKLLKSSSLCHYFSFMVVFLATATALYSFMQCSLEPARLRAFGACLHCHADAEGKPQERQKTL